MLTWYALPAALVAAYSVAALTYYVVSTRRGRSTQVHRRRSLGLSITSVLLLSAIVIAYYAYQIDLGVCLGGLSNLCGSELSNDSTAADFGLISFFFLTCGVILAASGISGRCKLCGEWWSKKRIDEKFLNRRSGFATVRDTAYVNTSGNIIDYANGRSTPINQSGTISYNRTARVTETDYEVAFWCPRCNHRWKEIETDRVVS